MEAQPAGRPLRERWIAFIQTLQDEICAALEAVDGRARFREDCWTRDEEAGGGGRTRVLADGAVFEKGGVNTSVVSGRVTAVMQTQLQIEGVHWFACGLSLVLHPQSPWVPTVHANWRYFELTDADGQLTDQWFGGGTDLTPWYIVPEDGRHFHQTLKTAIDPFGDGLYATYKQQCDAYFVNRHRDGEARGIGGVFYDHLRPASDADADRLFAFQQASGRSFLDAYLPIVARRRDKPYGEAQKAWQELRRGRYVEFNLIHDRGTLFGLKTGGRTESILMSLPPRVRWAYDAQPAPGSDEARLLRYLQPQDWIHMPDGGLEASETPRA